MTQRSKLSVEALIASGAISAASVSALAFAVGTKWTVDADGNVVAASLTTTGDIFAPGLLVMQRWPKTYADWSQAATSYDLDLGALHATKDSIVVRGYAKVKTIFDKTGSPPPTNVYLSLGVSGDTDAFLDQFDARAATGWKGLVDTEQGASLTGQQYVLPAAASVIARLETAGAPATDLDELTQGEVDIFLQYVCCP